MFRLQFALPLFAALAIGTGAFAQESEAENAAAEENAATEESAGGAASGLDLGQEVQEDASYVKETYGDWQLQCFRSDAEEDPCQMYQLLREEGGNPVAEFTIFKLAGEGEAVAGATIAVPLGTLLPAGLQMYVDEGQAKAYNFSFCSIVGCFARIGFTQEDIDALKAGDEAFMVIVPAQAPNEKVLIEASLDGFTKALENVSVAPN